jgi:hypothetical protein
MGKEEQLRQDKQVLPPVPGGGAFSHASHSGRAYNAFLERGAEGE